MPSMPNDSQSEWNERIRKIRRRNRLYTLSRILFLLFFLVFLVSATVIGIQFYLDWRDAELYAGLSSMVTDPTEPSTVPQQASSEATEPIPNSSSEATEPLEGGVLPKYQTVYGMNDDMFGWISIKGLTFNYPVMHTPEDEEYYLRRGFDREYSRNGVPFMDADCQTDCGNYLIYGHNINNGTMFAQLLAYEEEAFWKEHPVISFDTLYEEGEYEVMSVFYSRVFYRYETDVFRFYEYHDLTDPEVFREYVDQVKALSLYDMGVDAAYGDELITLITCSYGTKHERFVIVARKQS